MNSQFFLIVHTSDLSLGKIDKSTLSQQTLMELFIDKLTNKEVISGDPDDPKEISEWDGLLFNETNEVTEIEWDWVEFNGSLCFEWLPSSVVKVDILKDLFSDAVLGGTIDLTDFPPNMKECMLSRNDFTGEICLTKPPIKLVILDVSFNKLSGALVLNQLPVTLEILRLNGNFFTGSTDFSRLPKSLILLDISENADLSGEITEKSVQSIKLHETKVRFI